MFPALFFLISLAGLISATYTDLKERLIPNKLTYSLIATGIILQLVYSWVESDLGIFTVSITVMVLGFIGAYLLWKVGVWAGGDVKLFTALCILNPINYAVIRDTAGLNVPILGTYDYSVPAFPLALFIFSIFSMLPYGAIISINGIAKNSSIRRELLSEVKKRSIQLAKLGFAVVGINSLLIALGLTSWLVLPALILLAFLNLWIQTVIITILFIFSLVQNPVDAIYGFALLFMPLLFLYLLIKLYFVSKDKILKKEIRISEMEEGMITAETIVLQKGKVRRIGALKIGNIINHLRNNNLAALSGLINPRGKLLANSRSAAGITVEQLEELKEAVREKRIEDRIKIKLSAPFVPAMLIAYVILQLVGDLLWNVLFL